MATHKFSLTHISNSLSLCPLPVKKSVSDVKGLRKLYEKVESSARNLKTLDVDSSCYGNFLVPLINTKLPNELRLT